MQKVISLDIIKGLAILIVIIFTLFLITVTKLVAFCI